MIRNLFPTTQERLLAGALLAFWAVLFLPNLRTNPNWYGDEAIVMEEAWTLSQGQPRYGAMREDFLSPNPHPPLYLLVLGGFLKTFGHDILSGRILQILVALGTTVILFWVGTRLRDKNFGFLCAAAFLCYPEVVIHHRWVRGHPMMGMWALAAVGFLIQYVQDKRWKDIALAGLMTSLAVGSHYFAFPMMGVVILTALIVNRRHVWVAAATSGAFAAGFFLWFILSQPGGLAHLLVRFTGASNQGFGAMQSSLAAEAIRLYRLVVEFVFLTPTLGRDGTLGVDFWIITASLGMIFFPVARFRKWLLFWLLALMFGAFCSRNTVGMFLYQAFGFIPLLAVGFAGAVVRLGEGASRLLPQSKWARVYPAVLLMGGLGLVSLIGSLSHFQTKIDRWTVQSWRDAEDTMRFINAHTSPEDFVVMPDQLFWLYDHERKAQLMHCAHYEKGIEENFAAGVPKDQYWFDCRIANAKYLVLGYGVDAKNQPIGIDAIFWFSYEGPRQIVEEVQKQKWPIVFQQGEYMVLANPRFASTAE